LQVRRNERARDLSLKAVLIYVLTFDISCHICEQFKNYFKLLTTPVTPNPDFAHPKQILMSTLQATTLWVKCPHCGNKFTPEDAIGHDIRVQMEKEFENKLAANTRTVAETVRKQEGEKYKGQLQQLENDRKQKASRLQELETLVLSVQQREMDLKSREEQMETEMKRKLLERERLFQEQAEKRALDKFTVQFQEREQNLKHEREMLELQMKKAAHEQIEKARLEEQLKNAELQKKLDDQARLIMEMKRKSEQGSMQMQGEIQELAIEEYLENNFPRDIVEEISKGKRGGDCVHIVKDNFDRICGKILYESKRTKHFSYEWIAKVKDDMRLKQADLAVIVTEALPDGMTRFGECEGVWICTFSEFKALAFLLRHNLSRIGEILAAQENRGDKMQMIYTYVTGNEFRQKLEAAFESFNDMQDDLQKEKAVLMSQWAKREKKMLKAMENLVSLYGDIRGIAGGAVQEIKALEMPEMRLIYEQ
jgi:hypothetical protein